MSSRESFRRRMIQNGMTMCYIATVAEIYGSERHIEGVGRGCSLLEFHESPQSSKSSEEIQIKALEMHF